MLLGKAGHLLFELADVIGLSGTRLAPDLLAESIGEAVLKLADAGCQAGGALVGGKQVGLAIRCCVLPAQSSPVSWLGWSASPRFQ